MLVKIIYALAVALEFVFVPLFLKYSWPKKCWKSFRLKMVCSSLFLVTGICCMIWAHNYTDYAKFMIIGLAFGALGDLFLHLITDKQVVFGIGLLSFLIGHIFFIISFGKALKAKLPQARVFDYRAIIAIVVILVFLVLYAVKKKMKFGIATVPVALYAVTISTMLVTALQLCIRFFLEGFDNDIGVICTVGIGAIMFVMSDFTLALNLFGGQEKNRPLKIFNIATYFIGQVLLGTSILFIQPGI